MVKWYNSGFTPTVLENHLSATNVTKTGDAISNQEWGTDNIFYSTGAWPAANVFDTNNYIQFKISPDAGYKIAPGAFIFNARSQADTPAMEVRFSKNENFSTYGVLQSSTILSANYRSFSLNFPAGTVVSTGESLYIRIFVSTTYNNFHLQHNQTGSIAPTLTGTVSSETPVKPNAADDRTGTLKNVPTHIDILGNDDFRFLGALSTINPTKPEHGTVKVNDLKDVTYTPDANYTGYDRFYYTLTNTVGESNTAKVEVQVVDGTAKVLVRWNKADQTPTNYLGSVTGSNLNAVGESIKYTDYESAFELGNLPTPLQFDGQLDPSKYVSFSVKSANTDSFVYLRSLQMKYKAQGGSGNITIRYSKTEDFSGPVFTLVNNEVYTTVSVTNEKSFAEGTFLFPAEILHIRVYTYNTYDAFFINFAQNGETGPAVSGIETVYSPEPCQTTVTWDGKNWSGIPTIDKKAVLNASYETSSNGGGFEACSLTVNSGKLIINSGSVVTVQNEVKVSTGASFLVKSDANLIQKNNEAINTGSITVERTAKLKRLDYIYWASPVKNQNLKTFSPGTVNNRFYTYREGTDLFEVISPVTAHFGDNTTGFESAAKGYAIRANNSYPAETATTPAPEQVFTGIFNGTPNNGTISIPLQYQSGSNLGGNGYNLVGNPYPSNIDFSTLAKMNNDLIGTTAYFWTNLNANPLMQGSNYPNGDYYNNYAILNPIGGIPATSGKNPTLEVKPTRIIKVGQGFLVKAKKAGNLVFENAQRAEGYQSRFINKSGTGEEEISANRYWLHLTTPIGVVTTTLVGYMDEATNDYEEDYDADLLAVGTDALFTEIGAHHLGIQGRQAPLKTSEVIALGTSHHAAGNYTLSLGEREGIFAEGQNIYLKDKQTGILTNLSENTYSFAADQGLSHGRFEIVYETEKVLGMGNTPKEELVVYKDANDFVVRHSTKNMTQVQVFDMTGRLLLNLEGSQKEFRFPAQHLSAGIFVVKITLKTGEILSRKIRN